jgi:hypothetical protein
VSISESRAEGTADVMEDKARRPIALRLRRIMWSELNGWNVLPEKSGTAE